MNTILIAVVARRTWSCENLGCRTSGFVTKLIFVYYKNEFRDWVVTSKKVTNGLK